MLGLASRICGSKWVNIGCRLLLGSVFIYAAIVKMLNPTGFTDDVAAYRILPISLVNPFALVLPWVELLGGVAVLSGILTGYAAILLTGLNVMFLIAVGSAMARGLHISCGCFNICSTDTAIGWWLIVRDVVLILLCLPLIFKLRRS